MGILHTQCGEIPLTDFRILGQVPFSPSPKTRRDLHIIDANDAGDGQTISLNF